MISHAYPPTFGGVESHVWDISHSLSARGHEVLVIAGGDDAPAGTVPVHRHPALSVSSCLAARAGLPRHAPPVAEFVARVKTILSAEFGAFRPDLVHVHNAHHFGPELAQACLDVPTVPVLNGVHDRVGEHLYPEVLDWPWAKVVFVSEYLRHALPTVRPAAVRWLGIELDMFRPDGPRDARMAALDAPVVFHPARLLRWKGVTCGVRAFARIHREFGGSLVLCASDNIVDDPRDVAAYRHELTSLAADLGVADAVHFMGFDRQRIGDAYRTADLVWYPTIEEEPLGLVPMEAMACGVPLVVTRSGGMKETGADGRTGLTVPRNDPDALAAAARRVLSDGPLRASLVRNGREQAVHFGNAEYVDWLGQMYRSVLTANAGGVWAAS
jgi:glycogen synthase